MNIGNSHLLFLLIILLPVVGLLIVAPKRYKKRFGQFAEPGFWDFYFQGWSFFFFRLKMVLLVSALAFIILALVSPQWDRETQDIKRSGLDIAICIDASKSMDATDIAPSRLQRAKDQISAFIDEQKGDRIALIPFAGTAFIQCPLTDDYEAAKLLLSSLNSNTVPVWGTDIGKALEVGSTVFDKNTKTKVMILISDGEDLSEDAVKAAREVAQKGIIVYTMGVGTPEGAKIKLSGEEGLEGNFLNETTTKLDVKTLEKIASVTGGEFFMITPTQDEILAILKHISSLEQSRLSSFRMSLYKEQYHLFAIAALVLLLIETVLTSKLKKNNGQNSNKAIVAMLLFCFLLLPAFKLEAIRLPWSKALANSKGRAAYKQKNYSKADQIFGNNAVTYPKDAILNYNHGNSLYKTQKNKEAGEAWQQSLNASDPKLKSKAWQNLGNVQYQAKQYQDAMESYRKAVVSDDKNQSARSNYDLAKRMLKLKQQNQQQNKQNQEQQKQDKNKQNQPQQPQPEQQQNDKKEAAERILKALEQKEVNDRQNRQSPPQRMRNNKWW